MTNKAGILESLTKFIPFIVKLFALIVGGLLSLILSGDISLDSHKNAKLTINLYVIIKITCAVGIGLFIGDFVIDYWDFEHLNYYAQAAFYLFFSAFGVMVFGVIYRSIQLTFTDKTLSEIITEIKNITKAFIK